jgi:hypothetical protein
MTDEQKEKLAKLVNLKKDEAAVDVVFGIELALAKLGHWEPVRERARELRKEEGRNPWD